ncbi:hypothetical protein SE15_00535 [Thermanaerothrix daxensis]|uniref:Uncharacterized protein n=1 Tax=Thermanaerothrix daxensis TaxID=869279 RepID=A0A0P6XWK7_9CHLR|nr:hypothetical protein [Thermanaerothrix daxensis]KPL83780.1 hypothetical protein SE15_00535 [Thermanaerothrix daxensis]
MKGASQQAQHGAQMRAFGVFGAQQVAFVFDASQHTLKPTDVGKTSQPAAQILNPGQVNLTLPKEMPRLRDPIPDPLPVGWAMEILGGDVAGLGYLAWKIVITQAGVFEGVSKHVDDVSRGDGLVAGFIVGGGAAVTNKK